MNRVIFGIIALIVLGVVGFFALNNFIYNEKQADPTENVEAQDTMNSSNATVTPISHATMVLHMGGPVVYVDPVGGVEAFSGQSASDLILVTDIHGDHMDAETLSAVSKDETVIVVPQAVRDELPDTIPGTIVVMANGDTGTQKGIEIEAVPAYNVPESEDAFHTKGRGNGYILEANGERIYIAGDTGPTPEMKALQNIDRAFIPMNLPYTMTVEEAADAVLSFKPKIVHPYHYRGQNGFSNVDQFKALVNQGDPNITVELLNFYPNE